MAVLCTMNVSREMLQGMEVLIDMNICTMNVSREMLQGMEVLIDMNIFLGEKIHMRKSSDLAKTKDAEFLGSKCIHNVKNYPLTIRLEEEGFF